MKRAAIFVEGATEVAFVRRLVEEIAGRNNLAIRLERWHAKAFLEVCAEDKTTNAKYFLLIVDCQGDHSVKSAILDRRDKLVAAGYQLALGLRDVRPDFTRPEIPRLRTGLAYGLRQAGLPTHICLAVMEVEAWFVQEGTHFARIDPALDVARVNGSGLFTIGQDNAENLDEPASTLRSIYALAGKSYRKKSTKISRTINAIDYSEVYFSNRNDLPHLDEFVSYIDAFLT